MPVDHINGWNLYNINGEWVEGPDLSTAYVAYWTVRRMEEEYAALS